MSTNISKQKREDLLNKIKEIRTFISAAPQDAKILRGQKNNSKIRLLQRLKMNLCREEQQPIPAVIYDSKEGEYRKDTGRRECGFCDQLSGKCTRNGGILKNTNLGLTGIEK